MRAVNSFDLDPTLSPEARKRKQLSSDDDDESMCGDGSSAASPTSERPVSPVPTQDNSLLGAKRAKVEGARQTPLTKLLGELSHTLDKAQLLNLIVTMAEQFPALRDYVDSQVPRPTLQGVQVLLQNLEKKLRDAFPYTKWGPLRDDYAFNRVKPLLLEIKDTVLTFSQHFAGPERFPTTAFPFLYEAANVAFRLPEWDKPQNNTIKFDLVAALLESYRLTVESTGAKTSAGKLFGMQVVDGWARDILSLIRTFSESAGAGEVAPAAAAGEAAAVGVGAERQACWRALLQIAREFGDNLGWMCSPSTLQQLRHAVDRDVSGG
ncbi:MAG: hypothetical protein BJ554DRAFT_648 [Olpidium bornovanus]|uniref:Tethering factor for nuclear proteasome STS1 n=1 Tax=Olpidium bornovanus TaxID=278681 RepID=A0A8H7ZTH2_9FUNG|nr:MAG: hypothetical protein BJ554DRAFT_648 [Olpidium bornovanus]